MMLIKGLMGLGGASGMATNGSKWQLFGNILAADWQRIGS
jgi:hypothetical protein